MDELFPIEENPVIEGEVLEARFANLSTVYDRFSHVLVFDQNNVYYEAVPYMYLRNLSTLNDELRIEPVTEDNDLGYGVNGQHLVVRHPQPEVIVRFVRRMEEELPNILQEIRDLQAANLFTGMVRKGIKNRVRNHFALLRQSSYFDGPTVWLPENYQMTENDLVNEHGELEDRTRQIICGQIRCTPLPMCVLPRLSDQELVVARDLLQELGLNENCTARTLYDQMYSRLATAPPATPIPRSALLTLMAEEFRCVKNELPIDSESLFIFSDEVLGPHSVIAPEKSRYYLQYYVGDYLPELDLSRSFITGSAISASIILSAKDSQVGGRENVIDIFYPPVLTEISDSDRAVMRGNINVWNIRALSQTEGLATNQARQVHFTIKPGSDVDIAVDNTVSDEEYRAIAHGHFEVIRRHIPDLQIREYTKPKGDWNYVIYTENPDLLPFFREIEIYRSSFRNICTHHVGAVRGCYTSRWTPEPHFYLTASAVYTSQYGKTPNYHYFAGRKSNPQDIIIKNMQRGIGMADKIMQTIMDNYIRRAHIELSHTPFHDGVGVPYSVFSAHREVPYHQQRTRDRRRPDRTPPVFAFNVLMPNFH